MENKKANDVESLIRFIKERLSSFDGQMRLVEIDSIDGKDGIIIFLKSLENIEIIEDSVPYLDNFFNLARIYDEKVIFIESQTIDDENKKAYSVDLHIIQNDLDISLELNSKEWCDLEYDDVEEEENEDLIDKRKIILINFIKDQFLLKDIEPEAFIKEIFVPLIEENGYNMRFLNFEKLFRDWVLEMCELSEEELGIIINSDEEKEQEDFDSYLFGSDKLLSFILSNLPDNLTKKERNQLVKKFEDIDIATSAYLESERQKGLTPEVISKLKKDFLKARRRIIPEGQRITKGEIEDFVRTSSLRMEYPSKILVNAIYSSIKIDNL